MALFALILFFSDKFNVRHGNTITWIPFIAAWPPLRPGKVSVTANACMKTSPGQKILRELSIDILLVSWLLSQRKIWGDRYKIAPLRLSEIFGRYMDRYIKTESSVSGICWSPMGDLLSPSLNESRRFKWRPLIINFPLPDVRLPFHYHCNWISCHLENCFARFTRNWRRSWSIIINFAWIL